MCNWCARVRTARHCWRRWKREYSTVYWHSRNCRRRRNPYHPCLRSCAGRFEAAARMQSGCGHEISPEFIRLPVNDLRRNTMTIKAINVRNQFKGTIKEIIIGDVLSEIDVQTAAGIVT